MPWHAREEKGIPFQHPLYLTQHLSHRPPFTVLTSDDSHFISSINVHKLRPAGVLALFISIVLRFTFATALPATLQLAHMFFRCTQLPSEGWMLYIFLIDSTQGGWGGGMGNKSDKVDPSLWLSLSHFHSQCPPWLRLPFACSVYLLYTFLFSPLPKLLFSSICISPALCWSHWDRSSTARWGGLCNGRPDVLVPDL